MTNLNCRDFLKWSALGAAGLVLPRTIEPREAAGVSETCSGIGRPPAGGLEGCFAVEALNP
jgi:hypothetical protein